MRTDKDLKLRSRSGETIYYDLRFKEGHIKQPLVIISHGFECFKDWAFMPYLSEKIAEDDNIALTFNFRNNGINGRNDLPYDPDDFAGTTMSGMLSDMEDVISSIENGKIGNYEDIQKIWSGEIVLAGFSRGGTISIVHSAIYKKAKKLILWATPGRVLRYSKRQIEKWLKDGEFRYKHLDTRQELKISSDYIKDILNNKDRYDPGKRISEIEIPTLFIYGMVDMTVNMREARSLAENKTKGTKEFVIIEKAGHSFACKHPMEEASKQLEELTHHTLRFLKD